MGEKGALRGKGGTVEPQRLMDVVEPGMVSPLLPEPIQIWNELTRGKLQGAV